MSEPCYFISAGELRAIIGDDTDHGAGQDQHSGVWFLTSTKDGSYCCVSGKWGAAFRPPPGKTARGAAGR